MLSDCVSLGHKLVIFVLYDLVSPFPPPIFFEKQCSLVLECVRWHSSIGQTDYLVYSGLLLVYLTLMKFVNKKEKAIHIHMLSLVVIQENMMLKQQFEALAQENAILKRVVAIQHERQKEFEDRGNELNQLKQSVAQYQEQLRTLEVKFLLEVMMFLWFISFAGNCILLLIQSILSL